MHKKAYPPILIGTRGSPLALAQARMVADALCAAHGWPGEACELVVINTTGDRVQDRPLAEIGGKALWTKELDTAIHDGRIDIAVHSMKDVETIRPGTLAIGAMLVRADIRDRLISRHPGGFGGLPQGARLGTSSPRRAAQARARRPDLVVVPYRGNVATRLAKLEAGEADATLLAAAGLARLGTPDIGEALSPDLFLPAPAQGAIGIEYRVDETGMAALLSAIDHPPTTQAVMAERALLAALGGTCHTPVAAQARIDGDQLALRAEILLPDGSELVADHADSTLADAATMAADLAHRLLDRASPALRALFTGG